MEWMHHPEVRTMRVLLAIVLLVAACADTGGSAAPDATTVPTTGGGAPAAPTAAEPTEAASVEPSVAAPAGEPVVVKGKGTSKSKPFALEGGYTVDWTAKADSSSGCYHGANLNRADGEGFFFETLVNEVISDGKAHKGSTNLYNLEPTDYYVDANSGCDWTFTFTPA